MTDPADPSPALPAPPVPTRLRGLTVRWGERTLVMGILNVTPDSFSGDGLLPTSDADADAGTGSATATERAVDQARRMVAEGADLLDIGGESTRPGHEPVAAGDELARVIPVVAAVRAALPAVPLSIDTTKPEVAVAALDAGADLINDVGGTGPDEGLAALAAARGVPIVLMHSRPAPVDGPIVADVLDGLRVAIERAIRLGVDPSSIIVDPGIGFGKTADQNVMLLRDLGALRSLGRPILLGTSRKSTIGRILDLPADQRLEGTLATTALGIAAGVDIVRVHDVAANVRAARVSDAIIRGHWRADPLEAAP